jgi:DNA replication and repair protein RecF
VVIHPSSVLLLDGPPKLRRQFVDWGVFHVEPSYLDNWRRYTKALTQRNALLKQRRPGDLAPWNHEVAQYGTILAQAREHYLQRLQPHVDQVIRHFLPDCPVRIEHIQGWKRDRTLLQAMRDELSPDLEYGYTQSGPHKGDFTVYASDKPAKTYLSRGQAKLMVYALLLAQSDLLDRAANPVCILIDDVASELDRANRGKLLDLLLARQAQCFITASHQDDLGPVVRQQAAMFHVEHGRISPI